MYKVRGTSAMERTIQWLLALILVAAPSAAAGDGTKAAPSELFILAAGTDEALAGQTMKLIGPDARLQLSVTSKLSTGEVVDVSHSAQYSIAPEGVLKVDHRGRVSPLKDGTATITAASGDAKAEV